MRTEGEGGSALLVVLTSCGSDQPRDPRPERPDREPFRAFRGSPPVAARPRARRAVRRPAHRAPPATSSRPCSPPSASPRSTSWPTGRCPRRSATGTTTPPRALPPPATETEALAELRALAAAQHGHRPDDRAGLHGTVTPPVIRRNVLENPAWYTAYTPYQPEISQGRLEALLNFQTTVADLTGLPVAGASLLDEATAAAEAMTLLRRAGKAKTARFVVDADTLPQTLAVLRTRAEPLGIELVVADLADGLPDGELLRAAAVVPGGVRGGARPVGADRRRCTGAGGAGRRRRRPAGADAAHPARRARGGRRRRHHPALRGAVGLRRAARRLPVGAPRASPGSCRAGSSGCPATPTASPALRLALQTREQHIRREKATSNICTAQVLLAVVAACTPSTTVRTGCAGSPQRCTPDGGGAGGRAARGWRRGRARRVLRHGAGAGAGPGGRGRRGRAHRRGRLRRVDADTSGSPARS